MTLVAAAFLPVTPVARTAVAAVAALLVAAIYAAAILSAIGKPAAAIDTIAAAKNTAAAFDVVAAATVARERSLARSECARSHNVASKIFICLKIGR